MPFRGCGLGNALRSSFTGAAVDVGEVVTSLYRSYLVIGSRPVSTELVVIAQVVVTPL